MSSGPTDNVVEELVAQLLGAALALEDDVADETERNHTDVEAVPERTHSDDETVLDPFEPDALTCAICLESVPPPDMASVKGCDHMYCGKCILHWVVVKESNLCPQCKRPFDHLVVYRQLDGTVTDYPVEESVALLKRASWFTSYLQVHEKETVAKLMQTATHTPGPARTSSGDGGQVGELWDQYVYEYFEEQYDDDEELEDYYLRRARNRVVLGNRRWGENGYVRSGRMHARPASGGTASSSAGGSSAGGSSAGSSSSSGSCSSRPAKSLRSKGKNKPHPSCKPMPISGPRGSFSPAAAGKEAALSSSPGSSAALGTSPSGEGRRARRKARRAMADSATGGVTMPEMEP